MTHCLSEQTDGSTYYLDMESAALLSGLLGTAILEIVGELRPCSHREERSGQNVLTIKYV